MNQCGGSSIVNSAAPAVILPKYGGRIRKITRKGYTRRAHVRTSFSRKRNIHVRRTTVKRAHISEGRIPDQGAPGKWADLHGPGISIVHPGALSSVGYSVTSKPTRRHSALRKAVRKFGPLSTYRKLQAVGTYTKRTSKGRSKKFMADRNWVKKKYM